MRQSQPNVDISPLAREANDDRLAYRAAQMVKQEVDINPRNMRSQIVQLETARNRALYGLNGNRGPRSMEQALRIVGQQGGYYPNYTRHPISRAEFESFKQNVWNPVMKQGTNLSDVGWGPMTGNASDDWKQGPRGMVATHQFRRGQYGYHMPGGDTYFRENVSPGQGLPTMGSNTAQRTSMAQPGPMQVAQNDRPRYLGELEGMTEGDASLSNPVWDPRHPQQDILRGWDAEGSDQGILDDQSRRRQTERRA